MRAPIIRLHSAPLIVDSFAGGGGASTGIEWALGRSPDIAVNHDPEAIAMHQENHPSTHHVCGDVWDVDPAALCRGRSISLTWFSPDCKHFSKAKGGKPVEKKIRGLAWIVVRWAKAVRPRVIILENVEEFADWGPLLDDGRPDPLRRGLTFRRWLGQLKAAGYTVEMRQLRACDYGAPTTRKRLFVIARCDGKPIVWPTSTHAPGTYLTAATCIEWSIPCPSIFERARPLAEKTLRRIGRGIGRYVLETGEPFLVPVGHAGYDAGGDPRRDHRVHSLREPMRTITGARRGDIGLAVPTLIQTGYGERPGQVPRVPGLHKPLGVVPAGGCKHALVAAFLAKHYGGHEGSGSSLARSFDTVTTIDHHALVTSQMTRAARGEGLHLSEVRAFLVKYYGTADSASLKDPLGTVTTRDRFGIVTIHGETYALADIGMRMLAPRELFRAQGFPDSYRIDPTFGGRTLSKTAQIRMCGNSVSPPVAAALVAANVSKREVAVA